MAEFKVVRSDGSVAVIEAHRVMGADNGSTVLEIKDGNQWRVVMALAWRDLATIHRCMDDPGGTDWWAPVLPVPVFGMSGYSYSWVTCTGRKADPAATDV